MYKDGVLRKGTSTDINYISVSNSFNHYDVLRTALIDNPDYAIEIITYKDKNKIYDGSIYLFKDTLSSVRMSNEGALGLMPFLDHIFLVNIIFNNLRTSFASGSIIYANSITRGNRPGYIKININRIYGLIDANANGYIGCPNCNQEFLNKFDPYGLLFIKKGYFDTHYRYPQILKNLTNVFNIAVNNLSKKYMKSVVVADF